MDIKFKLLLQLLQSISLRQTISSVDAQQLVKAGLAESAEPQGGIRLTQAGRTLLEQLEGMQAAAELIAKNLDLEDHLADLVAADAASTNSFSLHR